MSWIDQRPDDAMDGAFTAVGPEIVRTVDPARGIDGAVSLRRVTTTKRVGSDSSDGSTGTLRDIAQPASNQTQAQTS